MLTLKTALIINGISSGITGGGLTIFPRSFAAIFGVDQTAPFVYSGIFLVVFAGYVLRIAFSKLASMPALKLINILDILWILGSITLVVADGPRISAIGNALIIVVAGWVGVMAALQSRVMKQSLVVKHI